MLALNDRLWSVLHHKSHENVEGLNVQCLQSKEGRLKEVFLLSYADFPVWSVVPIQYMCSGSMGCSAEPTVTRTRFPCIRDSPFQNTIEMGEIPAIPVTWQKK